MIQVSVSDIQKNPSIISRAQESVELIDKRKKEVLGTFIPKKRKKYSIVTALAGSLGKYVSEDKKNIPFEVARKKTQELRLEELTKEYKR